MKSECKSLNEKIKSVLKPNREKYEYNQKIIPKLFNYCDRPPGKYKGTPDMHLLGKIDYEKIKKTRTDQLPQDDMVVLVTLKI